MIIPYFFIGIAIFSLINLVQYVQEFIDLAIRFNAPLFGVIKTILYLIPFLMTFTIPVAVLIGILLSLGHLNSNSEIIAIRSSGVTYTAILKPAIVFGIIVFIFQLLFFEWVLPWGNKNFIIQKYKMLEQNPIAEITKKQSFSSNDKMIHVVSTNNNSLFDVTLIDKSNNFLYFAHRGILGNINLKTGILPITLYHVSIMNYILKDAKPPFLFQFYDTFTVYFKTFTTSDIAPEGSELESLSGLSKTIASEKQKNIFYAIRAYQNYVKQKFLLQTLQKEKNSANLGAMASRLDYFKTASLQRQADILPKDDIYIFQRNIAFAVNSIFMVFLATPLAFFQKRRGKEVAMGLSVVSLIIFNSFIAIGNLAYKQASISPYLAAWIPSVAIFILIIIFTVLRLKKS